MKKALNTAAVATIVTGIVMVEHFAGVGEAFEWIMGHPVWTHEMPTLADEARRRVLEQVPDFPATRDGDWRTFRDDVIGQSGEAIEIEQGDAVRTKGPIGTLVDALEGASEPPT